MENDLFLNAYTRILDSKYSFSLWYFFSLLRRSRHPSIYSFLKVSDVQNSEKRKVLLFRYYSDGCIKTVYFFLLFSATFFIDRCEWAEFCVTAVKLWILLICFFVQ